MSEDTLKQAVLQAKELLTNDQEFKDKLALLKIKSFNDLLKFFPAVWWLLQKIVLAVETIYNEYHTVTEEQRIEVASELLDELIEFKGFFSIFEPFDGMLWKLLLSAGVQALNNWLGHNWLAAATEKGLSSTELHKLVV